MNYLSHFFDTTSTMLLVYWSLALTASVVFAIQAVSLIVGFDGDSDFSGGDAQFDLDGMALLSVKTVTCFLMGFGWTGVAFYPYVDSPIWLGLVSTLVGVLFVFTIVFLLKQVLQLGQDNSFNIDDCLEKKAQVYLRIPAQSDQPGKVLVSIGGSTHEILAFTNESEEIPTGAHVRIVEVVDDSSVVVERL